MNDNKIKIFTFIKKFLFKRIYEIQKYDFLWSFGFSCYHLSMIIYMTLNFKNITKNNTVLMLCFYLLSCHWLMKNLCKMYVDYTTSGQILNSFEYFKLLYFNNKMYAKYCFAITLFAHFVGISFYVTNIPDCNNFNDSSCVIQFISQTYGFLTFVGWILSIYSQKSFGQHSDVMRSLTTIRVLRTIEHTENRNILLSNSEDMFKIVVEYNVECTICLECGRDNGNFDFVELYCGHKFHKQCIDSWSFGSSRISHLCPNCKQDYTQRTTTNLSRDIETGHSTRISLNEQTRLIN